MYRDAKAHLDERDRAVGAILIGEALIASCERAQAIGRAGGTDAWRAIRDAHDEFPEIWSSLDRAREVLAHRGVNVTGYDELRPTVRTRLATSDDSDPDAMQLDPAVLDDARRAAEELKLAVPGADWAAIDRRTIGLVRAPLIHHERNRLVAGGLVGLFVVGALTWFASIVPDKKPDRAAEMRRELAEITVQRRLRIIELQRALSSRCDPGRARELARQLVMDGRGSEAKQFAAGYTARCGEDAAVERWANAPRP